VGERLNGGVRLIYRDAEGRHLSKAPHSVALADDGTLSGWADFGGSAGRLTFSGRFTASGFQYVMEDGLEKLEGLARYRGEYAKPAMAAGRSRGSSSLSYWNDAHFTGSLAEAKEVGNQRIFWYPGTSVSFSTENARYDGIGGIDFSPMWNSVCEMPYLGWDGAFRQVTTSGDVLGADTDIEFTSPIGDGMDQVWTYHFSGVLPSAANPKSDGKFSILLSWSVGSPGTSLESESSVALNRPTYP
jgi:hypothetical protein